MERIDPDVLRAVVLLAPAVFAVLVYLYPVAVLLIGGLLAVYLGLASVALMPGAMLLGLDGLGAAIGVASGGVSMMAMGGALAAILRALRRPVDIGDRLG